MERVRPANCNEPKAGIQASSSQHPGTWAYRFAAPPRGEPTATEKDAPLRRVTIASLLSAESGSNQRKDPRDRRPVRTFTYSVWQPQGPAFPRTSPVTARPAEPA